MPSFFISSTFRDMHPERDILHKQVFPAVEACAKQYGDHVNICDLRWGIDTDTLSEQDSTQKILSGCRNAIDRCDHYFIGLIGNRYGFVLPEEEISVTELEISYVLSQLKNPEDYRHIIFYIREIDGNCSDKYQSENVLAAQRIRKLKEKLYSISGLTVKNYHLTWEEEKDCPTKESIETFSKMVQSDLQTMLEKDWMIDEGQSAFERDRQIHREYALRKCSGIFQRTGLEKDSLCFVNKNIISALKGPIGIGKSTLMSQLAQRVQQRGDLCETLFGGYTPLASTVETVLQHMVHMLSDRIRQYQGLQTEPDTDLMTIPQLLEFFDDLLLQYDAILQKEKKQFYFFLDAVDQLLPDEHRDSLYFITDAFAECRCIHMVISVVDSFKVPAKIPTFEIPELEQNEILPAAKEIAGIDFKELNSSVQRSILSQRMAANPLYLSLLVKRLLLMDQVDFQSIDQLNDVAHPISFYQGNLISSLDAALYGLCREITNLVAEQIGGSMVKTCLSYLAVSRYGLTESQLESLFIKKDQQFCYADFSMFIRYLDIFFIRRMDGKIDFSHKSLRLGILERYSNDEAYLTSVNHELAVLFSEDPDETAYGEMYWHLLESADYESFYDNLNLIKTDDKQSIRMASTVRMWLFFGHKEDNLINYPVKMCSIDLFNDLAVLFNHYLNRQLKESSEERVLALRLEQKLYKSGQTLESMDIACDVVSKEHFLRNMIIIRNVLAEIILKDRTEESLWKAIEYLEMNLPYLKTEPTDPDLRYELIYKDRIADYERLSDLYEYIGGEEHLKKAHLYLLMAAKTVEAYVSEQENEDSLITILSIYLRMARQSEMLSGSLVKEPEDEYYSAESCYHKCQNLLEKIVVLANQHEETDTDYIELLDALAYGYDALSEHYYEMRDQKHLKQAEELCLKSIEIGKQINRIQGSVTYKTIQGASYLRLALIYEELDIDEEEQNQLIEQNLLRGCYIYKSLMEELDTVDSKRDYAVSLGRMASHYHDLDSDEAIQKGLLCMKECLEIYETLVKNMPTPSLKDGLAKEKGIQADLYKAIHTKSALTKAYKSYRDVLKLRKEIYKEEKSEANLREIAFVYSKLAEILLDIDDERYATHALQYLEKDLKLLKIIARSGETIENLNDFQDAYEFIFRCYSALNNEKKLDHCTFKKAICYQKQYIRKCQRSRKIDPCGDTIFNLSAAYENLADLHFHKKGIYYLHKAEKYAKISYKIFKEYENYCGAEQCKAEWAVFYNHIGAIYLERHGFEPKAKYLKKSFAFLQKALQHNTGLDEEEYLISIKNLAEHPYTSQEKRRKYLVRSYAMAQKRYQETNLDWYRVMINDIEKAAEKYGVLL